MLWKVPFRTQLDGSLYQHANCGPASLAMVLEAFGVSLPTDLLRQTANRLQGSWGYLDGIGIDYLVQIAEDAGLEAEHLYDGAWYRRWYPELVRWHVRQGHPVLTLVKYRSLPGNDASDSTSDHYVVITGLIGDSFIYNDPAFVGTGGYARIISEQGLLHAWDRSDVPRLAVAFHQGDAPSPVALVQDWKSVAPAVGRGAAVPGIEHDPDDVPLEPFVPAGATGEVVSSPSPVAAPASESAHITWERPDGSYFTSAPTPAPVADASITAEQPIAPVEAPRSASQPASGETVANGSAALSDSGFALIVNPAIVLAAAGIFAGLYWYASWSAHGTGTRRTPRRQDSPPAERANRSRRQPQRWR